MKAEELKFSVAPMMDWLDKSAKVLALLVN